MQAVFPKYQQTTQLLAQQRENATLTFLWCSVKPDRTSQKVKSMPTTTFHFLFIVRLLPGCIAAQVPVHLTHAAVCHRHASYRQIQSAREEPSTPAALRSFPLCVEITSLCGDRGKNPVLVKCRSPPAASPPSIFLLSHPRLQSTIISASNSPEGKQTFKKFPITRQAKPIFLSMQLTAPTFTII